MDPRTTVSVLNFVHIAKPALVEGKSFCSTSPIPEASDCRFVRCDFDGCDISGLMFSDCVFEECSFRRFQMHLVRFWSCKFQKCTFTDGMWCNVSFRESTTFEACTFYDVELEDCLLIGCKFAEVAWNGGSLVHTYFDGCTLEAIAFTEAVVCGIFHDCTICVGAFDHIVDFNDASCITITSSSLDPLSKPSASDLAAGLSSVYQTVRSGRGQDPLENFIVEKQPTLAQLHELEHLLNTERDERPFQVFLENNPEVLSVAVTKGHHGIYVLPQVRFGDRHVADFMVGAKNSMGHFWTGLEIESPTQPLLKRDGHFTQKVQHAIDQVEEWRTYVRNNPASIHRPKLQGGTGLIGIEPDFEVWIVIGRDPDNTSAEARRARYLNSDRTIHIQTWDGLRARLAKAVGYHS
ncbi:MAG TPA: Shedu anti-phage system protein SduA domain-containing protein [Nitrospira sp.]|nr:Shedu anti-phage system protein SduA domain-containing protein [Nitrospira sp.]